MSRVAEFLAAIRLARRELRAGTKGLRVFLACLVLGVGAIAAVQSVSHGLVQGLAQDGRAILGGDLAFRLTYRPAETAALERLAAAGTLSTAAELRAMVRSSEELSHLVEIKAVDAAYPLVGAVRLEPALPLDQALAVVDGVPGAVVEPSVLSLLRIGVGATVRLGDGLFTVRAVIAAEPDRVGTGGVPLGPRVMVSLPALATTALIQPGSLIHWNHRVVLPPGRDAAALRQSLETEFPEAGWQVRTPREAAPQIGQFLDRLTLFLTLVGLTALLVGGIGIANGVRAFLEARRGVIATLRCLGSPARLVFMTYLVQIGLVAVGGICGGLVLGAVTPFVVQEVLAGLLPITPAFGIDPAGLALAAGFGLLTVLAFSLWPLGVVHQVSPAVLFRADTVPTHRAPPGPILATMLAAGLALAGLAVATASQPRLALWFLAGTATVFALFLAVGRLVVMVARRCGRPHGTRMRLAVANLHRPGNQTPAIVLSLGLGLTLLVTVTGMEASFGRMLADHLPRQAPAFFFIDLQPDQMPAFRTTVAAVDGTGAVKAVPALRGRITQVNGQPAEAALADPGQAWILRGDRGITFSEQIPDGSRLLAGDWWPADYRGEPLVSIYRSVADAFGIGVGATLGVNIMGRTLQAKVASIRDMNFLSLSLNFTLVFPPATLAGAPHTWIATVAAAPSAEGPLQAAVVGRLPNVSAVRVRETLGTVESVLDDIGAAVRGTAAVAVLAGVLVLAGALAAGQRRRLYDAAILKVLGATRIDLVLAHGIEYGLLGVITAVLAAGAGSLASWAVVTQVMVWPWSFDGTGVLATVAAGSALTVTIGLAATWWILRQPGARLLRNE